MRVAGPAHGLELDKAVEQGTKFGPLGSLFMDTDKKTSANMMKFVGGILALALILAGIYFFALTPEDPAGSTIGNAEQGTQDQDSR